MKIWNETVPKIHFEMEGREVDELLSILDTYPDDRTSKQFATNMYNLIRESLEAKDESIW